MTAPAVEAPPIPASPPAAAPAPIIHPVIFDRPDLHALDTVLTDLDTVATAEMIDVFGEYGDIPPIESGDWATTRPPGKFDQLIERLPTLILKYAAGAALFAAQWYHDLAPTLDYQAEPLYELTEDQLLESARWALFAPGETDALTRMSGSKQRQIFGAARDTIVGNADREGVRYVRVARMEACAFCRVLATREDYSPEAYLEEKTGKYAGYSKYGIRGTRKQGELYHDHCKCEVLALRPGVEYDRPAYLDDWDAEYQTARNGIENCDDLADELGICGEVPNIKNVSKYMRARQTREEGAAGAGAGGKISIPGVRPPLAGKRTPQQDLAAFNRSTNLDRLKKAKTLADVVDVAEDMTPGIPWRLKHRDMDLAAAKDFVRAVDDIVTKYPELRVEYLTNELLKKNELGMTRFWQYPKTDPAWVILNNRYMTDAAEFDRLNALSVAQGWNYKGTGKGAYDSAVHELGHVMAHDGKCKGTVPRTAGALRRWLNEGVEDYWTARQYNAELASNMARRLYENDLPRARRELFARWLSQQRSRYGATSADEWIADSFADVEINGPKAHDASKVVHRMVVDAFQGTTYGRAPMDWSFITSAPDQVDMGKLYQDYLNAEMERQREARKKRAPVKVPAASPVWRQGEGFVS